MSRTFLLRTVHRLLRSAICDELSSAAESHFKISRRQGLEVLAAATVGSALNACQTAQTSSLERVPAQADSHRLVIVGGGAAGLTAAYTLRKSNIKCDVFEATERLGGRIFTHRQFNEEGMLCERGGELIDTGHKEIQELTRELGLELQALRDSDSQRLAEVYSFGGIWRTDEQLLHAFAPLAKGIAKDASAFLVDGVFQMPTYKNPGSAAVKALDLTTLKEYLDKFSSISERWVRELIRVAYVGEYGLEAEQQSAINLVSFIATDLSQGFKMFGESDELFRIKGGNSSLMEKLGTILKDDVKLNHTLKSIARNSQGTFQLLFETNGKIIEVKASTCVIALPFSVLRGISGIDTLGLSPRKLSAIRELGYGSNSKLMLGFKSRYWRKPAQKFPANDGNLFTDLAMQGGWDSSRAQTGSSGIFTNFVGGSRGARFAPATAQDTLNGLETLYPGISKLRDGHQILQVWAAVPTAKGSYICPKPGQYTTLIGSLGESECEGQLLFAGEHTSLVSSGFMNGAVESGIRVAGEIAASIASKNLKSS